MVQIYLLGVTHSSEKSKKQIKKIFEKFKIDAILFEGVTSKLRFSEWIKEPFLAIIMEIYFFYLTKKGGEIELLKKITKDRKILFHNIDMNIHELVDFFHKGYNYIVFIGIFLTIMNFRIYFKIMIAIYILLTLMLYFFYFVSKTFSIRNESFVKKTKNLIKNKNYRNILIVCGKYHRKVIKDSFRNVIDLTANI